MKQKAVFCIVLVMATGCLVSDEPKPNNEADKMQQADNQDLKQQLAKQNLSHDKPVVEQKQQSEDGSQSEQIFNDKGKIVSNTEGDFSNHKNSVNHEVKNLIEKSIYKWRNRLSSDTIKQMNYQFVTHNWRVYDSIKDKYPLKNKFYKSKYFFDSDKDRILALMRSIAKIVNPDVDITSNAHVVSGATNKHLPDPSRPIDMDQQKKLRVILAEIFVYKSEIESIFNGKENVNHNSPDSFYYFIPQYIKHIKERVSLLKDALISVGELIKIEKMVNQSKIQEAAHAMKKVLANPPKDPNTSKVNKDFMKGIKRVHLSIDLAASGDWDKARKVLSDNG